MKKCTKVISTFLIVLMLISMIPSVSAQVDANEPVDFVLVLDCSASLFYYDRDRLCINACESFVDQLPVQDARVGVIGFGYTNEYPYNYTGEFCEELDMTRDASHVHQIMPLSELRTQEEREAFKETVVQSAEDGWHSTVSAQQRGENLFSPVVPALGAAVNMMEKSGSADNNGCIILISDGVSYSRGGNYDHTAVGKKAKEHGWPIYCIELNYATPHQDDVERAQKLMDEICASSGERHVNREYCASPTDVFVAFQRIFFDLWKYPEKVPDNWPQSLTLPGEFKFSVPVLTSEATVNVFGGNVYSVTLTDPDGQSITVSKDYEQDNFSAVVEENKYYSIKMICPKDGGWTCFVDGAGDASVLVNSTDIQEMNLSMIANAQSQEEVLRKDDAIQVRAFFSYQSYEVHDHPIYGQTFQDAVLQVRHSSGLTKEYPMQADAQSYYSEVMLNEFPGGALTLQVVLENNMFRSGRKYSNSMTFKTENLDLELTGGGPEEINGYVNSTFERIDLSKIFRNPDGDAITYELLPEDRSVSFDYRVDSDYMTIETGLLPGTYPVTVTAKDPDMVKPLSYDFTLHIEDRTPEVSRIPAVELWVDPFVFQKNVHETAELDLAQYMFDPDGVDMTYTLSPCDIVSIEQTGSLLKLTPEKKGTETITVIGSDGVSESTTEFEVRVISAKAAFWRDNWIKFAIAAAILFLLVIAAITASQNTKIKGVWDITFQVGNGIPITEKVRLQTMRIARKKVIPLKDFLETVTGQIDQQLRDQLAIYLGNQCPAAKIKMTGVLVGKGFVLRNIPKDPSVEVYCGGIQARGKVRIPGGTVKVKLMSNQMVSGKLDNDNTMTITFSFVH